MKSNRTRLIVLALAYAVSLASLVWTLRDAELDRLVNDVTRLSPIWIGLGVASMLTVYLVQGFRWTLILAPVGKLGVIRATRAVFAGLFISEVFPFRAGEIIRCYLVGN